MNNNIRIDQQACIRCRRCEKVCPAGIFVFEEKRMHSVQATHCIECGQCVAICPSQAVIHPLFGADKIHGFSRNDFPAPEALRLLMKARRSNRTFSTEKIPPMSLDAIIEAAYAAPTAQNLRNIQIIAVRDPEKIKAISAFTINTFHHAAKRLENPVIKCLLHRKMASVYAMIPKFKALYRAFYEEGKDPILHHPDTVLFFCAPAKSRFGLTDCNLAYQNASLMAESLGIAHFYTGFVYSALQQDKKQRLYKTLDIEDVRIFAGMALGMPQFLFERYADRAFIPQKEI